ncbi:MAG: acetate/propionate family kinase [Geminicoccaceae bacterium]
MTATILVVNAGSSSIKFELFDVNGAGEPGRRLNGQIDGIGVKPRFRAKDAGGAVLVEREFSASDVPDPVSAQHVLTAWLSQNLTAPPMAIGHRVVHGGPKYAAPVVVDEAVLEELETFVHLAPLHMPSNLGPIRAIRASFPDMIQVACFDTAFHRTHPEVADRYALPDELYREGVRRYGFHGLSYEFIASRLQEVDPRLAEGRVVVAHLGSGASMCAIVNGRSVDSTLGFSTLDGLPMGTRCGQLDPGVLLYLMDQKGMTTAEVAKLLYHGSGLKGLSALSNDVRVLLESEATAARRALDYLVYRVVVSTGALAAAMGGIDGFVFTAGIGENAAPVRRAVVDRLGWLGAVLDEAANECSDQTISRPDSRLPVLVIPTNEELMIARHTTRLVGSS